MLAQPPYTLAHMVLDFAKAIQYVPNGPYSMRALGNPANLAKKDLPGMQSLYSGISAVNSHFYEEFDRGALAKLILCIGMQESTADFALDTGVSVGYMQVSPASVVLDFDTYGKTVSYSGGSVTPGAVNVSDPGTSVILWGWYGNLAAHTGVSVAEYVNRKVWNIRAVRDKSTIQDAMLAWLLGPASRTSDPVIRRQFTDYVNRVADYWVVSGFGNRRDLQLILTKPLRRNGNLFVRETVPVSPRIHENTKN
jgi:hypothetical protein